MVVILMDSLNPADIKKKPTTMYVIAIPGGTIVHHGAYPLCNDSVNANILPQVTIPASPIPKKLTVASRIREDATAMVIYKKVK